MLRDMSDRSGRKGHAVKMMGGGQFASNNCRTTAVGYPARHAIEVGNIVTAAIERRDG